MLHTSLIEIEVTYASIQTYKVISLKVALGTTIEQAIALSGIKEDFPEINDQNRVGIFGKLKVLSDEVEANDRVEIYRPLMQEAMTLRKERAAKRVKQKKNWAKDLAKLVQPYRDQNKSRGGGG